MSDPRPSPPSAFLLCDEDLGLATDLYQLTMAAAYLAEAGRAGEMPRATFEMWVRRLPERRNFLVFAGLEQALAALAALRFGAEQVDYLRTLEPFAGVDEAFFAELAGLRFRGDVRAMPEGTVFFPGEPVLAVTGSLLEAQLVETLLLSIVNFQSAIASKAARLRLAADGLADGGAGAGEPKPAAVRIGRGVKVAEFGSRRAHGPQAAAWAARAAWIGGADSTSNVLAGQRVGMPVVGTMAHSFVMAFGEEVDAFRSYQRTFPGHTILLVDTYDTLTGVRRALEAGVPFEGVRLDSGDLGRLARETRRLLDEAGRSDALIFASGDMDEQKIARLLADGAPIDAFGVGTRLATSSDAPYLPGIYKLVEVVRGGERLPKFKASAGKVTYPGPKQVLREVAGGPEGEVMVGDRVLRLGDEAGHPDALPLLAEVMREGEILAAAGGGAAEARDRCLADLARLPPGLRTLGEGAPPYPVTVDPGLEELLAERRESVLG